MGIIVLEDWKEQGSIRYRIVIEEEIAELVATLSDTELETIKKNIQKEPITIHDIKEYIKKNKFTISKKIESEVYNILKSRGFTDVQISKILSHLRSKGYFKNQVVE